MPVSMYQEGTGKVCNKSAAWRIQRETGQEKTGSKLTSKSISIHNTKITSVLKLELPLRYYQSVTTKKIFKQLRVLLLSNL